MRISQLRNVLFLFLSLAACGETQRTSSEADPFVNRDHGEVVNLLPGDGRDLVENPESVTIYALHPYPGGDREPKDGVAKFHDYKILGSAEVTDAREREALVGALYDGIAASDGTVAACFNPRHGVRFERGGKRVDLVICFECLQIHGHAAKQRTSALTTRLPERVYDEVLRRHKLEKHRDS